MAIFLEFSLESCLRVGGTFVWVIRKYLTAILNTDIEEMLQKPEILIMIQVIQESAFCNISAISAHKIASRYFLIIHTNVPLTLRHESSENCEKIAILQNYFYAFLNHLNYNQNLSFLQHFFNFCTQDCC